jgi:predicted nucleotidyltransferase
MSDLNVAGGAHVAPERATEVNHVVTRVKRWSAAHPRIVGLLLVGSFARGAGRAHSDIDLVLLTTDPSQFDDDCWARELELSVAIRTQRWGTVLERRFATPSGLEVEFTIASASWADTDPVDPGTQRVIQGGALVLHDPLLRLTRLVEACRQA